MKKKRINWTPEYRAKWLAKNRQYYNEYNRIWMRRTRELQALYKILSSIPKDEPVFRL